MGKEAKGKPLTELCDDCMFRKTCGTYYLYWKRVIWCEEYLREKSADE